MLEEASRSAMVTWEHEGVTWICGFSALSLTGDSFEELAQTIKATKGVRWIDRYSSAHKVQYWPAEWPDGSYPDWKAEVKRRVQATIDAFLQ